MTRKHFVELAAAVSQIKDVADRQRCAEQLAAVCAVLNPRFNRARFQSACNVSA